MCPSQLEQKNEVDQRLGEAGDEREGSICTQWTPHGCVAEPTGPIRGFLRGISRHQVVQRPLHDELSGPKVSILVVPRSIGAGKSN